MTECPKCGAEVPANAPQRICPKCLMGAGLAMAGETRAADLGTGASAATPHSGGFVPPTIESLAPHFSQLELIGLLGQGGMGAVYKARQTKLDRLVALKVIRPESTDDPLFAERFNREARTLARLSHPNIVAVHDFGEVSVSQTEDSGTSRTLYYFVMEYVDGANLRQLLQARELNSARALTIVPQICEALQFAHDEGIVHRDIKPENILVDVNGRVKIADFGLAKLVSDEGHDHTLTGTYQVMGTPRYMAPEQMEGSRAVDHRADIYSLGVVFYEMLTGELPLGRFDPPSRKATIDAQWDEVVLRALEKEPDRRYQHASEVKFEVERVHELDQPPVRPADPAGGGMNTGAAVTSASVGWPESPHSPAQLLHVPTIGLIAAGALNCFCLLAWAVLAIQGMRGAERIFGSGEEEVMVWLFLSALVGLVVVFSALKMRQLEAYRLAICGAVVAALPITPGALIGMPMGLWALAVLTRDDVRRAFAGVHERRHLSVPQPGVAAHSAPRLSRKALIGACWAPFLLIAVVPLFIVTDVQTHGSAEVIEMTSDDRAGVVRPVESIGTVPLRRETNAPDFTPIAYIYLLVLLPLGLAAPVATTVLGIMSISDIRHSHGRLFGMPLAVADALVYPLLLLNCVILTLAVCLVLVVVFFVEAAGVRGLSALAIGGPAVLLALPVCIVVDFWIARAVWRRSTSGLKAAS